MQTKMWQFHIKKQHMKSLADQENAGTVPMYFTAFYWTVQAKSLKPVGRNLIFPKFFHTQHLRNCHSAALELLPDTHHGCLLIPGIYNRSLVFSDW